MKKQSLILLLMFPFLTSCSKTSDLYKDFLYNSPNFMENYYSETSGVREKQINSEEKVTLLDMNSEYGKEYAEDHKGEKLGEFDSFDGLDYILPEDNPNNLPWETIMDDKSGEFGRNNNLSRISDSFAYGYLSKLYDGRVRCESKYQLSRLQIDKYGYATFFPKKLANFKYFAFALRGATDYDNTTKDPSPLKGTIYLDLHISFYKHIDNSEKYDLMTFDFLNLNIPCDNGGSTNLVSVYLTEEHSYMGEKWWTVLYDLKNTVAMSLTYELKTTRLDLSDDRNEEKEHHFAVMLYEVMLPQSSWN